MIALLSGVRAYDSMLAIAHEGNLEFMVLSEANNLNLKKGSYDIHRLNFEFAKVLCQVMGIPFLSLDSLSGGVQELLSHNHSLLLDFRSIVVLQTNAAPKLMQSFEDSNVGVVSAMSDLFLGEASIFRCLPQPKKLLASMQWRKRLGAFSFDYWVLPRLAGNIGSLTGRPIKRIENNEIAEVASALSKSESLPIWVQGVEAKFKHYPMSIISTSKLGLESEILNSRNALRSSLGLGTPYLLKPHPRQVGDVSLIHRYEKVFGYTSINTQMSIPIAELSSIPLELLFLLLPNSYYIGVPTGSIHVMEKNRVKLISTGVRKLDQGLKMQYSEFMRYYFHSPQF